MLVADLSSYEPVAAGTDARLVAAGLSRLRLDAAAAETGARCPAPVGVSPIDGGVDGADGRSRRGANMTECVTVPSSEHVAEIVGRQGALFPEADLCMFIIFDRTWAPTRRGPCTDPLFLTISRTLNEF